MTLPGECVNDTKTTCHECGTELTIDIQKSAAGFYVGVFCTECGKSNQRGVKFCGHCGTAIGTPVS